MARKKKKIKKPTFQLEIEYSNDQRIIAGVDEVGRGCIAGPIVAAAVVFDRYEKVIKKLKEINDSKILTAKKRKELNKIILNNASDYGIGQAEVWEIDKFGIGAANIMAFKRALDNLKNCDLALIDGRNFHGFEYDYVCLEKGESKSISIAAASIVAKVYRDNLMVQLHSQENRYFFNKNKGYGGKSHYLAINKYGPSEHHRKSFMKWYFEKKDQIKLF